MSRRAAFVVLASVAIALTGEPSGGAAAPDASSAYARELGGLINDYRKQHGLQPLEAAAMLAELAHQHAERMAGEGRLSHEGFGQRLARTHAPHCVENVGGGYDTPRAEFEAWRTSPEHNRNLLDARIRYMGLGVERGYVAFFACG